MKFVDKNSTFRCLHTKHGESLALEPNLGFDLLCALKKSPAFVSCKLRKYVKLDQNFGLFADHFLKYLRSRKQ